MTLEVISLTGLIVSSILTIYFAIEVIRKDIQERKDEDLNNDILDHNVDQGLDPNGNLRYPNRHGNLLRWTDEHGTQDYQTGHWEDHLTGKVYDMSNMF